MPMELTEKLKAFVKEHGFEAFRDRKFEFRGWRVFDIYLLPKPEVGMPLTGYPSYALVRGDEIRMADGREEREIMSAVPSLEEEDKEAEEG